MSIELSPDLLAKQFEYLDDLRESGVTNMVGAGPYLQRAFNMSRDEAHRVLGLWMGSDLSVPPQHRAALSISKVRGEP